MPGATAGAVGGSHHSNGHVGPACNGDQPPGDRPAANGNGAFRGSLDAGPRRSTASQCKAIYAIARAAGVSLGDYLHERYQAHRPDELTLRQASEVIDDLKAAGVAAGGGT